MDDKAIDTARNVFTAVAWFGLAVLVLIGTLTALRSYSAVIYVCAIGVVWCASWLISEGLRHRQMKAGRINKVGWKSH